MKKTWKKIAMILIIVLVVNMFTGCVLVGMAWQYIIVPCLIGTGVVAAGVVVYSVIKGASNNKARANRGYPRRTNPYSYEVSSALQEKIDSLSYEDINSIGSSFDSISERELNSFYGRMDTLSEIEWVSALEAVNSFSVQELSVIIETFNSMSEAEIAYSIKEINSLPQNVSLASIIQDIEVDFSNEEPYVVGWR